MSTNNQNFPKHIFFRHLAQTTSEPLALEIEKAEGIYLYDKQGKSYIDLISGISVSNVGHRHPIVMKHIKDQLDKYMHLMVYGEIIQAPQTTLAKDLNEVLVDNLNCFYFLNSGSEAIEAAIKLSRKYSGRSEIIAQTQAYHGSSTGALSLMSNEYYSSAYKPLLPNIKFIEQNSIDDLDKITNKTAAIFIELIQAEKGCIVSSQEYIDALVEKCKETGTLVVVDEIQTGFGRTGSMFAYEQYGFKPDILLLAKALGGGMPIGAMITDYPIMQAFTDNPILGHISTFGGHPVSCQAAIGNLKVLKQEKLVDSVFEKEMLMRDHLKHPAIKNIYGRGLLLALEFENEEVTQSLIKDLLEVGILTDWFLYAPNYLRIAPPLIIDKEKLVYICTQISNSLNK